MTTGFCFVLAVLYLHSTARAAPACFDRTLSQYGRIIEKAMEFTDSGTRRMTVPEYGHLKTLDAAAKTAATGKLKCPGSTGSANVVLKGDLILIAGHALVDPKTCDRRATADQCTFQPTGQAPIKVAGLVKTGDQCPTKNRLEGDWALLRLERPVANVKPYKIKASAKNSPIEIEKVVAVGASSVDFRRQDLKTKEWTEPKHVQDCEIKRVVYVYDPVGLTSNCDLSHGASGGAFLDPDLSEPTLVGLITGGSLSDEEGQMEIRTHRPLRRRYNHKDFYSAGLAIDGKLYEAIVEAAR